jgi:hypothetical protein
LIVRRAALALGRRTDQFQLVRSGQLTNEVVRKLVHEVDLVEARIAGA